VPYLELLQRGGGIVSTMQATRAASEEELYELGRQTLMAMLQLGVTTVEGKSGYGLDAPTELRLLRTMRRLDHDLPLHVVNTYLGAHAVPPEYKDHADDYVNFIIAQVLPQVAAGHLAEFVDVFCETGVFTNAQSERIMQAAQQHGLALKLHADEMSSTGGAGLACRMGAVSADHLLSISDADIEALAKSQTVAVLLPATAFCMRKKYAPARQMIQAGAAVALASDYNPGSCYTYSVPLILGLAVIAMQMTTAEALTAMTLNAAAAVGRADRIGSIEKGKRADIVLLNAPDYRFLVYKTGLNLVDKVFCCGNLVYNNL
jgi:imidazolonepropionase